MCKRRDGTIKARQARSAGAMVSVWETLAR
jgi:hypothetical protein